MKYDGFFQRLVWWELRYFLQPSGCSFWYFAIWPTMANISLTRSSLSGSNASGTLTVNHCLWAMMATLSRQSDDSVLGARQMLFMRTLYASARVIVSVGRKWVLAREISPSRAEASMTWQAYPTRGMSRYHHWHEEVGSDSCASPEAMVIVESRWAGFFKRSFARSAWASFGRKSRKLCVEDVEGFGAEFAEKPHHHDHTHPHPPPPHPVEGGETDTCV